MFWLSSLNIAPPYLYSNLLGMIVRFIVKFIEIIKEPYNNGEMPEHNIITLFNLIALKFDLMDVESSRHST